VDGGGVGEVDVSIRGKIVSGERLFGMPLVCDITAGCMPNPCSF